MPTKTSALLTIHGMGRTARNYSSDVRKEIVRRLGGKEEGLYFDSIYYQDILQGNEDRVWQLISGKLRWRSLREFVLFGLADAAGLETNKNATNSVYTRAQVTIARALYLASRAIGLDGLVVILSHSLGGQVLSNYLWDAQCQRAKPSSVHFGVWANLQQFAPCIGGKAELDDDEVEFLSGATIRFLFTTGCNIPIFVAAHGIEQIVPIEKPRVDFEWHNYYDRDDVLGWPLRELSPSYSVLVTDHRVNAAGNVLGWFLRSWNPMSHGEYWRDGRVLRDLVSHLDLLL